MKKTHLVIFILLSWRFGAKAQFSEPSSVQAFYTSSGITLDGNLNETVWDSAVHISNFTQRELNFGQPVTERTEVAIAYNKEYLFIGVWCYDSFPNEIIAKEMKRDFEFGLDDNFMVIFDTYRDKRNGFQFITNPNGARADLQVFNNGSSTNISWNGVWDVRTTRNAQGWFAEFIIPLYTLKYRVKEEGQIWGINFERNIRRKREQSRWQGWSRDNSFQQVNRAGTLTGLDSLRNKQFVEFKPFATAGRDWVGNESNTVRNIGGDINYLITPTYRLNLTVNTDFAQVESDRQQVNITRFPLFFPELREFFLEGNDFFDMGFGGNRIIPFYTRKIGLNDNREPVPILAGARILGKENNRTLGFMSIQTAETEDQPTTQYTTMSWRQDVGKQSVIGAMSTNKIVDGRWHSTTGVNGRYSLPNFRGNKNIDIGGAFIQTYNSDTSLLGDAFAYRLYLSYPNDRWQIFASTQRSPANFNPEVGLMRRTNFQESFAMFIYQPRPTQKFKFIRQYDFRPAVFTFTQYDDNKSIQSFEYQLRYLGFETRSGEFISLDYKRLAEGIRQDFNIFDSITIEKGTYWWNQWEANLRTFAGRTFGFDTYWIWGEFYNGSSLRSQSAIRWRVGKHLNVYSTYERNQVYLPEGNFETNLYSGRIDYAINPRIFGSIIGQWNNATHLMNFNYRLQIIPKIGADFYLIVNDLVDIRNGNFKPQRTTVLGKFIWRFTT